MAVGFRSLSYSWIKVRSGCLRISPAQFLACILNSPDCNFMDYYMWSMVEKETNHSACNAKAKLMALIKVVFEDLSIDTEESTHQIPVPS